MFQRPVLVVKDTLCRLTEFVWRSDWTLSMDIPLMLGHERMLGHLVTAIIDKEEALSEAFIAEINGDDRRISRLRLQTMTYQAAVGQPIRLKLVMIGEESRATEPCEIHVRQPRALNWDDGWIEATKEGQSASIQYTGATITVHREGGIMGKLFVQGDRPFGDGGMFDISLGHQPLIGTQPVLWGMKLSHVKVDLNEVAVLPSYTESRYAFRL